MQLLYNQTSVINPLGFITTSVYSANSNRMSASVDPLGNRTSYTFDLAGQQTSRQDARGNRITYSYDLAGRQIALRNELNLATTTSYDAAGRPTTILDANGWLQSRPMPGTSKEWLPNPYPGMMQIVNEIVGKCNDAKCFVECGLKFNDDMSRAGQPEPWQLCGLSTEEGCVDCCDRAHNEGRLDAISYGRCVDQCSTQSYY